MVHRREVEGREIVLGNQGDLYGNAMTWWDHDTGSVWSQPTGLAILGERSGMALELLPSTLTTWGAWREAHPDTLTLDVQGWATGFRLEDMAIVVDLGTEAVAYDIPALREVGVHNDTVAGRAIAVVIDPDEPARWAVFGRDLDGVTVDLRPGPGGIVDSVTGSVFDPFRGIGRSGPLAGRALTRVAAATIFPADFATFFPDGRRWPGSAER